MALPSSQPVTWLLCREVQMSRVRRTRQVPAGALAGESLTLPGLPSQTAGLQRIQPQAASRLSGPRLRLPGLTWSRGLLGLCPVLWSQRLL